MFVVLTYLKTKWVWFCYFNLFGGEKFCNLKFFPFILLFKTISNHFIRVLFSYVNSIAPHKVQFLNFERFCFYRSMGGHLFIGVYSLCQWLYQWRNCLSINHHLQMNPWRGLEPHEWLYSPWQAQSCVDLVLWSQLLWIQPCHPSERASHSTLPSLVLMFSPHPFPRCSTSLLWC